jgi:hypothetical protein
MEDRVERGEGEALEREAVRQLHETETAMKAERIGVESELSG